MTFKITQKDSSPSLLVTLGDGTDPVDLTNVNDVRFIMQDKYERIVINEGIQDSVNIIDVDLGQVEFIFDSDQTADAGTYEAEWEVEFLNGAIETFPTSDRKMKVEIVEQIG